MIPSPLPGPYWHTPRWPPHRPTHLDAIELVAADLRLSTFLPSRLVSNTQLSPLLTIGIRKGQLSLPIIIDTRSSFSFTKSTFLLISLHKSLQCILICNFISEEMISSPQAPGCHHAFRVTSLGGLFRQSLHCVFRAIRKPSVSPPGQNR